MLERALRTVNESHLRHTAIFPVEPVIARRPTALATATSLTPLRRLPRSRQQSLSNPLGFGFFGISCRIFKFLDFRLQHPAVQPSLP